MGLRIGSGLSIVVYVVASAAILRSAGYEVAWISRAVARAGAWVITGLLTLGSLANFASTSPWERFLLGPVTLVIAGLCLVVARRAEDDAAVSSSGPRKGPNATH